jgi:UDPglucose 6-dehydrogenase
VSTTLLIKSKILRNNPLITVTVFPENLQLGNSLKKLTDPQFIFFGVDGSDKCESSVPEVFNYTGQTKIIKTDYNSAELIKHGINSFIASNIIYGNEFGKVVRDFGGNLELIIETIKLDNRVSSYAPIKPGAPISGGTLLRDLQVLTKNSQELSNYWQRLIQFNQDYKTLVYQILRRRFLDDLCEINCLVLGSNYKINSNSARNSYAQDLIKLLDKKVKSIYVTKSSDFLMENRSKELLFISSLDEVIAKIDCVILLYNPYSREDYLSFIDKNPGVFIIDFINNRNFYVSVKADLHLLGA